VTPAREQAGRPPRTVYWVDPNPEGVNRRLRETIEARGVRVVPLDSTAALVERLAGERLLRLVPMRGPTVHETARVRIITNRNRPEDGGEAAAERLVVALQRPLSQAAAARLPPLQDECTQNLPILVFTLRRERVLHLEQHYDGVLVATGIDELLRFALDDSLYDLYGRKRRCAICGAPDEQVGPATRYPRGVCPTCAERALAPDGEPVRFHNTGPLGTGCARHRASGVVEDDPVCFIDGIRCRAEEARFGGIVIQRDD